MDGHAAIQHLGLGWLDAWPEPQFLLGMLVGVVTNAALWWAVFAYVQRGVLRRLEAQRDAGERHIQDGPLQHQMIDLTVAGNVHARMNAMFYQCLIARLETALREKGYRFVRSVHDGAVVPAQVLPGNVAMHAEEAVARQRAVFLYPAAYPAEIEERVDEQMSDGYAGSLVRDLIESLAHEGFQLEADSTAMAANDAGRFVPVAGRQGDRLEQQARDLAEDTQEFVAMMLKDIGGSKRKEMGR